jgi:hypothetical protein
MEAVMVRRILPRGAASRARPAALAFGALIVLAACGSQQAPANSVGATGAIPGGRASAHVALCKDIQSLTRVVITRTTSLRETQPGQVLPRGITLNEPAVVRHLATTLCGLPKARTGPVSCPADFGGSFRLAFAADGRAFPAVTVQTSGCLTVTGLGPPRRIPTATLRTLGMALGLKFPAGPASPSGGGVNP